jgi:hypothetical protein
MITSPAPVSLIKYYFSFYGIGDAIKAWKGCGIAQRRLCRSLDIASRGIHDGNKAVLDPGWGYAGYGYPRWGYGGCDCGW